MLETQLSQKIGTSHPDPEQLTFFEEPVGPVPLTEGVKYSGSKLKLLPCILSVIKGLPVKRIFDGFSGTTRVSQALAKCGYEITSNDLAVWSEVFGECYLKGKITAGLQDKIDYLNGLKGRAGWFTKHYGGKPNGGLAVQANGRKRLWQIHNTKKLDGIRPEIDKIAESKMEKSVLLTSLILALDKVDNTLGHYASYLREWSPRSFKKMKLKMPLIYRSDRGFPSFAAGRAPVSHSSRRFPPTRRNPELSNRIGKRKNNPHQVMREDIFKALRKVKADLSYFDPPYGSNNEKMPPSRVRYASYYHIWKTVILNDEPELAGKANRRADCDDRSSGSVFEEFRKDEQDRFIALTAIERLIKECRSPYILLSYSNGGRAGKEEICEIIETHCSKAHVFSVDYKKNVMSGMRWTYDWTKKHEEKNTEFLFLIEKR